MWPLRRGFVCPSELAQGMPPTEVLPGRLLRVLRFWPIDFRELGSNSLSEAMGLCAEAVSGAPDSSVTLWEALCQIADSLRPRSGSSDLPRLLDLLRGRVRLRAHPDYRQDLQRCDAAARSRMARVRETAGDGVRVDTSDIVNTLDAQLREHSSIVLHGPSGAIKTALAKAIADRTLEQGGMVLWMDGSALNDRGLAQIEGGLRLDHTLETLLVVAPHP